MIIYILLGILRSMLATIVDVFSQFIDYRIYQRERERDACFTRLWLTPAAKQG